MVIRISKDRVKGGGCVVGMQDMGGGYGVTGLKN